jgi:ribose/xylose/arabinose/galactoside ABC-type transport system permease subunit
MAKKKKTNRKQRRAPATARAVEPAREAAEEPIQTSAKPVLAAAQPPVSARWLYVGRDIRRIGWLVGICIVAELLLWFALKHTGLGSHMYGVITP